MTNENEKLGSMAIKAGVGILELASKTLSTILKVTAEGCRIGVIGLDNLTKPLNDPPNKTDEK